MEKVENSQVKSKRDQFKERMKGNTPTVTSTTTKYSSVKSTMITMITTSSCRGTRSVRASSAICSAVTLVVQNFS